MSTVLPGLKYENFPEPDVYVYRVVECGDFLMEFFTVDFFLICLAVSSWRVEVPVA